MKSYMVTTKQLCKIHVQLANLQYKTGGWFSDPCFWIHISTSMSVDPIASILLGPVRISTSAGSTKSMSPDPYRRTLCKIHPYLRIDVCGPMSQHPHAPILCKIHVSIFLRWPAQSEVWTVLAQCNCPNNKNMQVKYLLNSFMPPERKHAVLPVPDNSQASPTLFDTYVIQSSREELSAC